MYLMIIKSVLLSLAYGLEFEPQPDSSSTLIAYRGGLEVTSSHYRHRLDSFLAPYNKPRTDESHFVKCIYGDPPARGSNQVCDVDMRQLSSCTSSNNYMYSADNGGPCVFLKLRKERDWVPDYYTLATVPKDMPLHLKEHIRRIERNNGADSNELKVVWVSCTGDYAIDKENIGTINYYPTMGFGGQYFPIRNEDRYLRPLVALHFKTLERGIVVHVQCTAWARNLKNEVVNFVLMVDY